MPRVNRKVDAQVKPEDKGTNVLLTVSVVLSTALIVGFLIWLIIFLVGKKDKEEEFVYKDYITISLSQLNTIINSNKSNSDTRYQDLLNGDENNTALHTALQQDASKPIYILFYSSEATDYILEEDDYANDKALKKAQEQINKDLEELVLEIKPDNKDNPNAIFLLFDYYEQSDIFTTLYDSCLYSDGKFHWLQESIKTSKGPYILKISSSELNNDPGEVESGHVKFEGYSGASDFERVKTILKKIANKE
jgi:hypothetical protein